MIRIGAGVAIVFILTAVSRRTRAAGPAQSSEAQATNINAGFEGQALEWLSQPENSLRGISLGDDMVFSKEEGKMERLSVWTTGHKTLLFMRVDFSDFPGGLSTEAEANALIGGANSTFAEYSYGAVSISGTVTPVLRMPRIRAEYNGNLGLVLGNARAAALAAGYDTALYDLDVVQYDNFQLFDRYSERRR